MSKAPAVQFYTGDFLTGTALMSNAEVGLYIRLLCLQAEHGSIPDDVERIVTAYGNGARSLWPSVRKKFEPRPGEEGTLVNKRMSEVVEAREAYRVKQSEKGKASAAARSSVQPRFNHGSTTVQPYKVEPLGDGVKNNSGKERAPEGFDAFYAAYPNKKAKGDAVKAWAKMTPSDRALCLPAILAQVRLNHFRGTDGQDYIPHPATWLNARRWEDAVAELKIASGWNPRA